jgi:hypothetical protein
LLAVGVVRDVHAAVGVRDQDALDRVAAGMHGGAAGIAAIGAHDVVARGAEPGGGSDVTQEHLEARFIGDRCGECWGGRDLLLERGGVTIEVSRHVELQIFSRHGVASSVRRM